MVFTNYSCCGHLDDVTLTIYANLCVLMPGKKNFIDSVACEKMFYIQYLFGIFCFKYIPRINSPEEYTP